MSLGLPDSGALRGRDRPEALTQDRVRLRERGDRSFAPRAGFLARSGTQPRTIEEIFGMAESIRPRITLRDPGARRVTVGDYAPPVQLHFELAQVVRIASR